MINKTLNKVEIVKELEKLGEVYSTLHNSISRKCYNQYAEHIISYTKQNQHTKLYAYWERIKK